MREIVVLPAELANQIAAGEVVERPASIVKELVENALDAEATRITISIEGGGIDRIEIADDGFGMDETNAERALLRHATSKLRSFDDLLALSSYGFRGEALPSIASVSRFSLETRARSSEQGIVLEKDGTNVETRTLGRPVGTTVVVRDLFYNVPARRKFLKSSGTEAAHVGEVVLEAALTRPEVGFELFREGRSARRYPRAKSREERARAIWEDTPLTAARATRGPLVIEAYLADAKDSQKGANGLRIVVNGRAVRDRGIAGTIAHAFGDTLPRGHYPRGVVYLDLPPALVDVNVHPQKLEVRFAESRPLLEALHSLLKPARSPGEEDARPRAPTSFSFERWRASTRASAFETRREAPAIDGTSSSTPLFVREKSSRSSASTLPPNEVPAPSASNSSDLSTSGGGFRFLGHHPSGFIVAEDLRGVHALDPHALFEVVHHERIVRELESAERPKSRPLLFPVRVGLEEPLVDTLEKFEEVLAELSLVVRRKPDRRAEIVSVPEFLVDVPAERLVRSVIARLGRGTLEASAETVREALLSLAPEFACYAARLAPLDPEGALSSFASARYASECVHGRVLLGSLWASEIERKLVPSKDAP